MRFAFVALLCACFVRGAYAVPAISDYVFDGDTFAAYVNLDDGIQISVRVRLINIDTPEIHGACQYEIDMAARARERLAQLIPNGTLVDLQNIKDDKYLGRIDANVILPDGRDAGQVLIDEKLGRPYSGGRRQPWCDNKS